MNDFARTYLGELRDLLDGVAGDAVDRVARRLLAAYEREAQVLVAGNGGSASTASHVACDLAKTVLGADPRARADRLRVVSLADNVALLTAWANDVSYDAVFAEQVKLLGRPGDVLVLISVSGNSPNLVEAADAARRLGIETVALLGVGGAVAGLVDDCICVANDDYGHVESAHLALGHLLTAWLGERIARHARSAEQV